MKRAGDIAADYSATSPQSQPPPLDKNQLEAVRAILLAEDRERIEALAKETAALEKKSDDEKEALLLRIQALQDELDRLRELNREGQARAERLQEALDHVRDDLAADQENRVPFLIGRIGEILSAAAQESRQSIASALSPIMGAAISTQIRNSQDEMVDALQPIILRTVQKAIGEFARDLQRNIDARLKATLGPSGLLRSFRSRISGVDDSDLILRESLPFALDEIFLIQRDSGLMVAYDGAAQDEPRETELISGMLTAIRDFARHSLGDDADGVADGELDEVQYGDQRIIIESGTAAYVAAVVRGVEPDGFHIALAEFVADLHFNHGQELREFDGDAASTLGVKAELVQFRTRYAVEEVPVVRPMSSGERWLIIGGGIVGVIMLALACFYLQFTIALLPVAFGETPTPTSTPLPTATATELPPTATPSPTATSTPLPSATPTATYTVTPTPTLEPTATAVPDTPMPTLTPEPATAFVNVWARVGPGLDSELDFAIPAGTELTILDSSGIWLEVDVMVAGRQERGWVPAVFVNVP